MLVVIVIIGILAGMITGAAMMAKGAAKNAVISSEINQMDMAIKEYKNKFGDYPPDFAHPGSVPVENDYAATVTRHLSRAFPRYPASDWVDPGQAALFPLAQASGGVLRWQHDLKWMGGAGQPGIDYNSLDPSTALVFWLGGIPTIDTTRTPPVITALNGFSANPLNPFDATSTSRIKPFFDFDLKRLKCVKCTGDNLYQITYLPPNDNDQSEPYVYFRANYYVVDANGQPAPENDPDGVSPPRLQAKSWQAELDGKVLAPASSSVVTPYYDAQLRGTIPWGTANAAQFWLNNDSFQVLSPGRDGLYWNSQASPPQLQPGRKFPTGTDYTPAQYDDITNFSGGKLGDKMP